MRKWLDPLFSAWVGVVTHKLRSVLTILGIVIGVAAVITLMSIGRGAEAQIISRIQSLGANLVLIRPGATFGFGGIRGASGSAVTLTFEDAAAIAEEIPYIDALAPSFSTSQQLVSGRQNMNAQITGVTLSYEKVYNLQTTEGTFISESDYERNARVAVIGSDIAATLFPGADPVGQQIRVGNNILVVIGVLKSKGAMTGSTDSNVLIPLPTMQQMIAQPLTKRGERIVNSIALTVNDKDKAKTVVEEITSLLRTRHQLTATADNDFTITSLEEIAGTISEAMGTMTLLLGPIAAISLLVGVLG